MMMYIVHSFIHTNKHSNWKWNDDMRPKISNLILWEYSLFGSDVSLTMMISANYHYYDYQKSHYQFEFEFQLIF